MGNNVSQDQFNSHLSLIHESIKDSNKRTDEHFSKVLNNMQMLQKESSETRMEILMMTKEHTTRLDNHATKIRELETDVKHLNEHKTKTQVYWYLFGTVLVAVLGAVLKLLLFK
jgi:BMFP domain-containing protein YqiC